MGMESQLSVNARHQLDRFCRQYLQVTLELDYPTDEHLRNDVFQQDIYDRLFSEDVQYVPPPRYQLRVLKELMKRIEASIQDWDEQVCILFFVFYRSYMSYNARLFLGLF